MDALKAGGTSEVLQMSAIANTRQEELQERPAGALLRSANPIWCFVQIQEQG